PPLAKAARAAFSAFRYAAQRFGVFLKSVSRTTLPACERLIGPLRLSRSLTARNRRDNHPG
ncbi:MAG: hypothetical protein PHU78_10250, partial [Heliobacteriaceae bacterium]|nr:hypothetical protein [Heliobacteriaceae bacterium]